VDDVDSGGVVLVATGVDVVVGATVVVVAENTSGTASRSSGRFDDEPGTPHAEPMTRPHTSISADVVLVL
jgi:hypothetical protein